MELHDMEPDTPYKVGNLWAKVTPGTRGARPELDRLIWISTDSEGPWVAVTMEAVAGVAGLISANERTVWPRPRYSGDGMFRRFLAIALRDGLKAAKVFKKSTYGKSYDHEEECLCR